MAVKKISSEPLQPTEDHGTGRLFASKLLLWNQAENKRDMPWKGEKNPYRIWLSEIILQQTRVEQGLKYYENFITTFQDIHSLASADDDRVFKLWEGLGYYSRCRNLLATARHISNNMDGRFPDTYEGLLLLKGVGSYTAAAIASFAFNQPYAVLDGNVFRVLSRIVNDHTPTDTTAGKKRFAALAQAILPKAKAGEYNQSIMDFGATVCKPAPLCEECFFNRDCRAYLRGTQDELPRKEKILKSRDRWFHYLIIQWQEYFLIRQRTEGDIWQQLFEFMLMETTAPDHTKNILKRFDQQYGFEISKTEETVSVKQKLTHQNIHFNLIPLHLQKKEQVPGFTWVHKKELRQFAFPKTLQQYLVDYTG